MFYIKVRIDFGPLFVRYLWPLLWPQYPPLETRPTLHSPLGLSQGLKSSSTREWGKGSCIAMLFNTKIGIMVQSLTSRTWYVFYGVKMSDIDSPQYSQKNLPAHTVLCIICSKVRSDYLTLLVQQFFIQTRRLVCRNTTPHP
jgi:hypothetical protein